MIRGKRVIQFTRSGDENGLNLKKEGEKALINFGYISYGDEGIFSKVRISYVSDASCGNFLEKGGSSSSSSKYVRTYILTHYI